MQKLKEKLSNTFVRNAGWLGASELINRVLRLGTTVTLSRLLTPEDYGTVAIVLTVNEIATVFTLRTGIGSKLIQANEADLELLCNTAYWLNWIFCFSLFIIQCLLSFGVAYFYGNDRLILPICFLALSYFLIPAFSVQGALIYRANRLNIIALCTTLQSLVTNILTIALAFLGFGMWAIVVPVFLCNGVWLAVIRYHESWRLTKPFNLDRWQEIIHFAKNIMGVELLDKLRANIDYLLVGRFIGIEALGFYYFAFNAGLGISLNILNAFSWSLFPYLCEAQGDFQQLKQRYFQSIRTMSMVMVPMILLQSTLAPFYVPIIFGAKWISAIPVLILICLSALPRPFYDPATQVLQAIDKTHINLYWNVIFTLLFITGLLISVQFNNIYWVAASVLGINVLLLPLFSIWTTRYVFHRPFR